MIRQKGKKQNYVTNQLNCCRSLLISPICTLQKIHKVPTTRDRPYFRLPVFFPTDLLLSAWPKISWTRPASTRLTKYLIMTMMSTSGQSALYKATV
jgi:hypothetical protein